MLRTNKKVQSYLDWKRNSLYRYKEYNIQKGVRAKILSKLERYKPNYKLYQEEFNRKQFKKKLEIF